ncbi:MAG: bacteriohemerythrin [Tepidanaerobacteraceae bacterium]|jgi:hemerythrin|nr:bacteriohemerythrin [Tepidanaerobacteraceae bacterium]
MAVQWTEDLATGIEEIDSQHKELFNRINALVDACSKGKGKEELTGVINFLGDYVVMHFGAEEKRMKAQGFPDYDKHKKQHDDFIGEFRDLKEKLEQKGPTVDLVIKVNHFLFDWLMNHIRKMDKVLGAFLKKNSN